MPRSSRLPTLAEKIEDPRDPAARRPRGRWPRPAASTSSARFRPRPDLTPAQATARSGGAPPVPAHDRPRPRRGTRTSRPPLPPSSRPSRCSRRHVKKPGGRGQGPSSRAGAFQVLNSPSSQDHDVGASLWASAARCTSPRIRHPAMRAALPRVPGRGRGRQGGLRSASRCCRRRLSPGRAEAAAARAPPRAPHLVRRSCSTRCSVVLRVHADGTTVCRCGARSTGCTPPTATLVAAGIVLGLGAPGARGARAPGGCSVWPCSARRRSPRSATSSRRSSAVGEPAPHARLPAGERGDLVLQVERFGGRSTVVPVTTRQVLEVIDDAILVLDPRGRVIDATAARSSSSASRAVGASTPPPTPRGGPTSTATPRGATGGA